MRRATTRFARVLPLAIALAAPIAAVPGERAAHAEPAVRGLRSRVAMRAGEMIRGATALREIAGRAPPREAPAAEAKQWAEQSRLFHTMAERLDAAAKQIRVALERDATDATLRDLDEASLRLQMAMDRENRAFQAISNMLKSRQHSAETVIHNMK